MYLSEEAGNFRKLKSHGQYSKKIFSMILKIFFKVPGKRTLIR